MSETDLTPYFLVYIIIVFLCPWCIFAIYGLREFCFLIKNKKTLFFNEGVTTAWRDIQKFRKENAKAKYLYGKVKKWMVITLLSWIIGFLFLVGFILFLN